MPLSSVWHFSVAMDGREADLLTVAKYTEKYKLPRKEVLRSTALHANNLSNRQYVLNCFGDYKSTVIHKT